MQDNVDESVETELFDFSVIILTYNSDRKRIRMTLDSVIKQQGTNFEIIVADDGSQCNNEGWLTDYFNRKKFNRYKLVFSSENKGTVENVINGLQASCGNYVKIIGAGDMLSDSEVLKEVKHYMDCNGLKACFGLIQGFVKKKEKLKKAYFSYPRDIEAYRKRDKQTIARNIIYYTDHVSGAAMFFEKGILAEYINRIKEYVVYQEDLVQVLMVLDGIYFELYDRVCVNYEVGHGLSSPKSEFADLLIKDQKTFYEYVYSAYPSDKNVGDRKKLRWTKRIRNIYFRTILRMCCDPYTVVYLLKYYLQILRRSHFRLN